MLRALGTEVRIIFQRHQLLSVRQWYLQNLFIHHLSTYLSTIISAEFFWEPLKPLPGAQQLFSRAQGFQQFNFGVIPTHESLPLWLQP